MVSSQSITGGLKKIEIGIKDMLLLYFCNNILQKFVFKSELLISGQQNYFHVANFINYPTLLCMLLFCFALIVLL